MGHINSCKKNKRKTCGEAILEFLLYFFVFFPYVTFVKTQTDLQMYCLVISFLCVIYYFVQSRLFINKKFIWLLAMLTVAILIMLVTGINFNAFRSLANYCSITFISIATFNIIKKFELNEKYCKFFIWVWFIVGLVQITVNRNFLSFLLSQGRTTEGRGVFGLANEPSFYGIIMSLALLVVLNFKKKKWLYAFLITVQVVFFAQSMMGIIALAIVLIIYLFNGVIRFRGKSLIVLLVTIFLSCVIMMVYTNMFPYHRLSKIIVQFFNGTLLSDESVLLRMSAITDSFNTFFANLGMPNGFGNRIMSGFGAPLVELGIFAIPIIFVVCSSVANVSKCKRFYRVRFILFFVLMLFAIQLAHPMVAFLVGFGMQIDRKKRQDNRKLIKSNLISGVSHNG